MLDKRQYNDNILYHDMPLEDQHEWFGYSRNKFLHNIDTFYYSVKFRNDFRLKSKDPQVEKMRKFFKLQYTDRTSFFSDSSVHRPICHT